MWTTVAIIALSVGVALEAINQIVTNFTIRELRRQQQQLQQQLEQKRKLQSE